MVCWKKILCFYIWNVGFSWWFWKSTILLGPYLHLAHVRWSRLSFLSVSGVCNKHQINNPSLTGEIIWDRKRQCLKPNLFSYLTLSHVKWLNMILSVWTFDVCKLCFHVLFNDSWYFDSSKEIFFVSIWQNQTILTSFSLIGPESRLTSNQENHNHLNNEVIDKINVKV